MKNSLVINVLIVITVVGALMSFTFLNKPLEKDILLNKGHSYKTKLVSIGHTILRASVADSTDTRVLGLSGRDSIAPDEAMLFVFDKPDFYAFWMKDMFFSIDIIWVDEFKRVVHISKGVSPISFPKKFVPASPAKYVLETSAGFSDKFGVLIGDMIYF